MIEFKTTHLITGEELSPKEAYSLIDFAIELKKERKARLNANPVRKDLQGKHLAMIFDKPSLRTRFSFAVAMNELGGFTIESAGSSRKHEEPEDFVRVLSGYCHGIMIRTYEDQIVQRMASSSSVPIINGLTDLHHPCQIFADLMSLQEAFHSLKGLTLTYIGDGNNILHSLLLLAPPLGVNVHYACPEVYQPNQSILEKAKKASLTPESGKIFSFASPESAVKGAQAVYTDVWASMGFESEASERERHFAGFQVNEELMTLASHNAVVMHCLPMIRGKEISKTLPDHKASILFQQSENRLHIQKALLIGLLGKNS